MRHASLNNDKLRVRHAKPYHPHLPHTPCRLPNTFDDLYDVGQLLGKGGFGIVHTVTERATGNLYAVKTLPKRFGPDGNLAAPFAERVKNEARTAHLLHHAHLPLHSPSPTLSAGGRLSPSGRLTQHRLSLRCI